MVRATPGSREARRGGSRAIPYPWVVLVLIVAAKMAGDSPNFGLPLLFPFIQEDLDLSRARLGLITSSQGAGGIVSAFCWVSAVLDSSGSERLG